MEGLEILKRIAKSAKRIACAPVYKQFISAIEFGDEKKAWQIVVANKNWVENNLPSIKLDKIPVDTNGKLKFYKSNYLVWEVTLKDGNKLKEISYYFNVSKYKHNIWTFKNGKLNGKSYGYYLGNKLENITPYKNDKIHGKRIIYNIDGSLYSITNFKNGLLHGEFKMYHDGFIYHYTIHKNGHEVYRNEIFYHEE